MCWIDAQTMIKWAKREPLNKTPVRPIKPMHSSSFYLSRPSLLTAHRLAQGTRSLSSPSSRPISNQNACISPHPPSCAPFCATSHCPHNTRFVHKTQKCMHTISPSGRHLRSQTSLIACGAGLARRESFCQAHTNAVR